jgi:hypothetical protein
LHSAHPTIDLPQQKLHNGKSPTHDNLRKPAASRRSGETLVAAIPGRAVIFRFSLGKIIAVAIPYRLHLLYPKPVSFIKLITAH